ncbi:MAG: YidB family protein [Burkholderiaceae bacterium]
MSILNTVLGALGGSGGGNDNPLMGILTNMLSSNSGEGSGLGPLLEQLQQGGLGDAVQSWVGTGQNLPVSADQLMQAFGADKIGAMAQQAGVSTGEASGQLAQMLPQLIDKLTPGGQIPTGNLDMGSIASVLGSMLKR